MSELLALDTVTVTECDDGTVCLGLVKQWLILPNWPLTTAYLKFFLGKGEISRQKPSLDDQEAFCFTFDPLNRISTVGGPLLVGGGVLTILHLQGELIQWCSLQTLLLTYYDIG